MKSNFRVLILGAVAALSFCARTFQSINPFVGLNTSDLVAYRAVRSARHITAAQNKRRAKKRRNQLRHKRALRG